MKVYAPIKTNLVQNPKLHEFITAAGPNFCGLRAAFGGGGGSHGFRDSEESPTGRYFYHSAGTTVTGGFADYYSRSAGTAAPLVPTTTDIQAKEGDVFYVTLVARATAVPSTGTMPRSVIRYAWRRTDGTTIGNTFYDLQIGNHGTEYAAVSGALGPAPAGAVSLGIQVEGRFGANNATGDEIRYVGATITKNQANTGYFDGDTPGYSWSGAPNESITVSDEKEFGDREVRANGVKNYYPDPGCERQSGTVVVRNNFCTNPSFRNDTSGWVLGTENVSVASLNRVSSSDSVSGYVGRVTFTGSIAAKSPIFYTFATTSASRHIASFYIKSSKSGNFAIRHSGKNHNWTEVEADTWTRINAPFITAPTSSEFGISTDVNFVSGDTLEFGDVLVEHGRALLPFFDGSYNTWESNDLVEKWVGTAGDSASRLVGMNPSGVSNQSEPNYNPCWLSTDNPYHGDYFVRCLLTDDDGYASYIDVTPTINTLVGRQVTGSVRVRTSKPLAIDIRYRGQVNSVGWSSDISRPAGVWEEARGTGVQNTNNDRWIRPWTQSVPLGTLNFGALVDVDAAMFTVGGYSGDYFDGDSPNAEWAGTPNNSVSVLKQFAPAQVRSYDGTNWVAG